MGASTARAATDRLEEMDREAEALGHEADLLTGELRRVKYALAADTLADMRQRLINVIDFYDPRDDYLVAAANTIREWLPS